MVKIWRLYIKQHKSRGESFKLPIVIPLLICHARKEWPKETVRLTSLLSGPKDELVGYIPDFGFEVYDLRQFSDDQIKGSIMNRVMLLLFKYIFKSELQHKLPDIFSLLRTLMEKETGLQYLEVVIRYLASVLDEDELSVKQIKEMVEQAILTLIWSERYCAMSRWKFRCICIHAQMRVRVSQHHLLPSAHRG